MAVSRRIRITPFHRRIVEAGVTTASVYNNTLLPVAVRGLEEDYHHLKAHVQLWDVSAERQVEIVGKDAAWLAQYTTPRELSNMRIGQCKYAPLVDEFGGIVNDPIILMLAEDRFWFSIASSDVLLWIKGIIAGRGLNCRAFEPPVTPLAIQGPKSAILAERVFGDKVNRLKFFWFDYVDFQGHSLLIAKSGWSKQAGFEIYLDKPGIAEALYDTLSEAGEDLNVGAGSPNLIERIEGGLLSYGNDMTLNDTPYDCGLDKYCDWLPETEFMGKEALSKIREDNGGNFTTTGLHFSVKDAPSCLDLWPVFDGETLVGNVTSTTYSPKFDCQIALVMIKRSHAGAGQHIHVQLPDGRKVEAKTVALPMS